VPLKYRACIAKKEAQMKLRIATTLLAAVTTAAVAASFAGAAAKSKVVAFTASYSGTAVVKVTDNVADITANGTGKGTIIGSSKITGAGKGDSSVQPCVPFSGPGTMTAANGTKLMFTVISGSQGCGDEKGEVFSISGKAKVTKGLGKLAKARGTLKFTGIYDRNQGTFSVKFKGSLTI
jgi:hypothetical protein